MTAHQPNPYASSDTAVGAIDSADRVRRWPLIVALCASSYYLISAFTIRFVNVFWIGEIPPLAIIQLPKSFLKSVVHDWLLRARNSLGLSSGSHSPDWSATHGWAMLIMAILPALVLVAAVLAAQPKRYRRRLIGLILLCAFIDAVVTISFDKVSSLKLFNASYF